MRSGWERTAAEADKRATKLEDMFSGCCSLQVISSAAMQEALTNTQAEMISLKSNVESAATSTAAEVQNMKMSSTSPSRENSAR